MALLVAFGREGSRRWRWTTLETGPYRQLRHMGIEKVTSSTIRHYDDIREEEKVQKGLAHEGIRYFMSESAASVFVWDAGSGGFKRFWVSK